MRWVLCFLEIERIYFLKTRAPYPHIRFTSDVEDFAKAYTNIIESLRMFENVFSSDSLFLASFDE